MIERDAEYYEGIANEIKQIAKYVVEECYKSFEPEVREKQINEIKRSFVDELEILMWKMSMPIYINKETFKAYYLQSEDISGVVTNFLSTFDDDMRPDVDTDRLMEALTAIIQSSGHGKIKAFFKKIEAALASILDTLEAAANDIDKDGYRAALNKQESQKKIASTLIQALGIAAMVTGLLALAVAVVAYGSPNVPNISTALEMPVAKILDIAANNEVIVLVGGAAALLAGLAANMLAERMGNALVAKWSPERELEALSAQAHQHFTDTVADNLSKFGTKLIEMEKAIRAIDGGGIANQ